MFKLIGQVIQEVFDMRGRERLVATAAIWIALAVIMNNLVDRFTRVSADFTGLWPVIGDPNTPMREGFSEIWGFVNENAQSMMAQVNQAMSAQLAANMPVLVILSLALMLAATLSTYFVWRNPAVESAPHPQANTHNRVERVLDYLHDHEVDELRQRLAVDGDWDTSSPDQFRQ